jgi:ribonuclease Z
MTTTVTITGTGVPHVSPGRAGPGVLVTYNKTQLQFDAGRATTLRLSEAGVPVHRLTALFITHHHSDHLTGLTDVLFTRWLERHEKYQPLPVFAPNGPATHFLEHILDPWAADIDIRQSHVGRTDNPAPDIRGFDTPEGIFEVWRDDDSGVRVLATCVHHEPVMPAVAYRVETPDGAIVISGDTRVCEEVETLAKGARVLVHEAMRQHILRNFLDEMPHLAHLMAYHSDIHELGAMAQRINNPTLVLTHLIPAPAQTDEAEQEWVDDIRSSGFAGEVIVARDLATITF